MIEAHGLTKRYGGKVAVDGLTFTVRPGVVTGFLGPNGARGPDLSARPPQRLLIYSWVVTAFTSV
jgi:ABC-type enterochelin transport system ATPase subunit